MQDETKGLPQRFLDLLGSLKRGDFSDIDRTLGHENFTSQMIEWHQLGYFVGHEEMLAEAFATACFLGHADAAEYFLDQGVDPYAGMATGLSGFHWAASAGQLAVIKLLTSRKLPMEVKNMYDGTVLGQALYSAINEHRDTHADIIETLINAGAYVWPETLEWWEQQNVPSETTKRKVSDVLRKISS